MKYPPFCDIIVISFNSLDEKDLIEISNEVYEYIKKYLDKEKYKIFKPMPSPIDKIQNRYRYRMIIKGNMEKEANEIFNKCLKKIYEKGLKTTRVTIDVNPNNMS